MISGPGRYSTNLVNELANKGHLVTVVTPMIVGDKMHEKDGGIEVHRVPIKSLKSVEKFLPNILDMRIMFSIALRGFFRQFDVSRFDILHILDVHDSYFLTSRLSKAVPTIISVNDYYSFETPWNIFRFPYRSTDMALRYLHYNATKVLNSKYLKIASMVISDTKYTADSIAKNAGVPRGSIRVVYKGVDLEKFTVKAAPEKYKNHNMLFVGSNMERKGVADIVRAMPEILKEFPDARLTIIGRASKMYKRKIESIIRKNGLNSVEILDGVASGEITRYYENANVFVLAPVIEDLAQVLLEAMSTKTPVVCTGVGANPEGVVDGVTGLLVKPKSPAQISDAVKKIFKNQKMAKEMGEQGRKRAESLFASSRMLGETMRVYSEVLGG